MRTFFKVVGGLALIGACVIALKKIGEKVKKWSDDFCTLVGLKKAKTSAAAA